MTKEERERIYEYFNLIVCAKDSFVVDFLDDYKDYIEMLASSAIEHLEGVKELSEPKKDLTDNGVIHTIELAREFLDSVSDKYGKEFETAIQDGTINLYYLKEKEEIDKKEDYSYFTPRHDDGFRIINEPLEANITDTCILVHEFIHLQNVDTLDPSFEQLYLTEGISRTYELLFYKFLKDNLILKEENNVIVKRFLKRYLRRARQMKILTNVIRMYDEGKADITKLKDNYEEAKDMYVKLSKSLKYFIGESIAIYTYQNILRGIVTPKNIEQMSDNLGAHENFTSLNYVLPKFPNKDEFGESIETLKEEIKDKTMKL